MPAGGSVAAISSLHWSNFCITTSRRLCLMVSCCSGAHHNCTVCGAHCCTDRCRISCHWHHSGPSDVTNLHTWVQWYFFIPKELCAWHPEAQPATQNQRSCSEVHQVLQQVLEKDMTLQKHRGAAHRHGQQISGLEGAQHSILICVKMQHLKSILSRRDNQTLTG